MASSFQRRDPWPLYARGEGAYVWDVDGHRLIDFHNGFGAMVQGHGHPAIARAVAAIRSARTSPRRRRTPSRSPRRSRGASACREVVVKMEGGYHGHHDAVMVDGVLGSAGIPAALGALGALTVTVPYNDAAALEARLGALARADRPAACVIMEPAFLLGVVLPELPGFSHGLGARGCLSLSPVPVADYATLQSYDDRELRELVWLHRVNRGILTTPARPEQWLLSVAHGETEADAYVGAFAELAAELTG